MHFLPFWSQLLAVTKLKIPKSKIRIKKIKTRQNWKTLGNLIFDVTFLSVRFGPSVMCTCNLKILCEDRFSENFQKYVIVKSRYCGTNYKKSLFSKLL